MKQIPIIVTAREGETMEILIATAKKVTGDTMEITNGVGMDSMSELVAMSDDMVYMIRPSLFGDKQTFITTIKPLFHVLGIIGYVMLVGATMAQLTPGSSVDKLIKEHQIDIDDLPLDDRSDCIWLVSCEHGKQPVSCLAKINDVGGKKSLGEWKSVSGCNGDLVITDW